VFVATWSNLSTTSASDRDWMSCQLSITPVFRVQRAERAALQGHSGNRTVAGRVGADLLPQAIFAPGNRQRLRDVGCAHGSGAGLALRGAALVEQHPPDAPLHSSRVVLAGICHQAESSDAATRELRPDACGRGGAAFREASIKSASGQGRPCARPSIYHHQDRG
jgi:hypothetical protein